MRLIRLACVVLGLAAAALSISSASRAADDDTIPSLSIIDTFPIVSIMGHKRVALDLAVQQQINALEAAVLTLITTVQALQAQLATIELERLADLEEVQTALSGSLAAVDQSVSNLDARVSSLESPPPPPAPPVYLGQDIGTTIPGTTTEVTPNIAYNTSAEGVDIWSTADSVHFAHKQVTGDFDKLVQIASFVGPSATGKAGIMVRESLNANSQNILMGTTINDNGYRFQWRQTVGGSTTKPFEGAAGTFPNVWVRLKRAGNVFTGYTSPDGLTWTQRSQQTLALSSTIFFGLATASASAGNLATATFRNFGDYVAPETPPPGNYQPSPAIVAVAGQTITKVRIENVSGGCIKVLGVANVTILDVQLVNCGGHAVRGDNASNLKVLNSLLDPGRVGTALDTEHGVYLTNSTNVLVQGNIIKHIESGVEVKGGHTVKVVGNYIENPVGPFPRGQMTQMYPCNRDGAIGTRCEVTDNYFRIEPDEPDHHGGVGSEDAVNGGSRSMHLYYARNYIRGGGAVTGCGLLVEGGSDNALLEDNILIETSGCGVNIAAAAFAVVRRNKALGPFYTTNALSANLGIGNWYAQGDTRCHDNQVYENIVANLLPTGSYNDIWMKSGCGTQSNNTKGAAALSLLTPIGTALPPPSIPPLPWTP